MRKGKGPVRPAMTKAQSNLQEGEEEWAELMRKSHGQKGADWYAKGMKTVEVSVLTCDLGNSLVDV